MLTIYHLEQSRSTRIIWLAEELGLEYRVKTFKRTPTLGASADFKALHPLARSPLIRDADLLLPESGAIVEYLLVRYGNGRLVPEVLSPAYAAYLFWFHFAEGTMMPHFVSLYRAVLSPTQQFQTLKTDPNASAMLESLGSDVAYAESVLSTQPFLAGDQFTACDIMMCLALQSPKKFKELLPSQPGIDAYLARLLQRPAYQKAAAY
jgi:glutathione S-transferase